MKKSLVLLCILLVTVPPLCVAGRDTPHAAPVATADLDAEVLGFLNQEIAAHVTFIKSYEPAPDKVFSAGTTGEYTWGTFMNAVGAYAALSKNRELAGRDLAHEVGQI